MSGSFTLSTIAGTRVRLHGSWLIFLVLLTATLATSWFSRLVPGVSPLAAWAVSGIAAFLMLVSVLLHELAHLFAARKQNIPIESVTLFVFGGIADLEQEPRSATVDFRLALAGFLTSLLMGSGAALLGWLVGSSAPLFAATLYSLAVANLVLALFNLIPGFPLDGGEVLRALLWRYRGNIAQATYWSALVGQIVAYLLLLAGLWQLFAGNVLTGLWLGFVGWFMLQAANIANAQRTADALFQQTRVGKIMRPVPLSILPAFTLQEVVEDYLLPQGLRTVPVVENNRLIGLVTLSGIRHIPHSEWGYTSIRQVMLPLGRLHVATPHQSANEALSLMIRYDINQVPVVQADQIVGMVSREHLLRILEGKQAPEVVGTQLHTPATGFRVNSNEHTGRQAPEPAGSVLQPHAAQMDRTDHESA